jgi:antitoxin component of MazEF toxin-antitoxin module
MGVFAPPTNRSQFGKQAGSRGRARGRFPIRERSRVTRKVDRCPGSVSARGFPRFNAAIALYFARLASARLSGLRRRNRLEGVAPAHIEAMIEVRGPGVTLRFPRERNYRNYMAVIKLKVARIGNSRGIRLPAKSLARYRIGESVLMEERSDGILLRPDGRAIEKLSWEATAKEMAVSGEDWSEWDRLAGDGLDTVPWTAERKGRVAER